MNKKMISYVIGKILILECYPEKNIGDCHKFPPNILQ